MSEDTNKQDQLRQQVREGYTKIASEGSLFVDNSCGSGGCCGGMADVDELVSKIGYSSSDVQALPEGANMGLSCGNPTALAELSLGETVLDLGSGGGFDVFIAAPYVGPEGRVIGVDMTSEMISKARKNTTIFEENSGLRNVEFRLGEIEHLPVADKSIDVVISNCVLNLSPNKPQVWKDIFRVLKPGGRAAISDLALYKPLPENVKNKLEALIGCVAGAELLSDIERDIKAAGLLEYTLTTKPEYIATLDSMQDPLYQSLMELLPEGSKIADYVTSVDIRALKSAT